MAFDRKAYMKKWNAEHREQKRALQKKYYWENPDKFRKRRKEYRIKNLNKENEYIKKYREAHSEQHRKYMQSYLKEYRTEHRAEHNLSSAEQRKRHPYETKARSMINHAIRDGKLVRNVCEVCGDKNTQAHHDDYNYPLKVRWLCIKCHNEWHRNNKPIRAEKG